MKRILLALFLAANMALALLLFKNGTLFRDKTSVEDGHLVIRQASQNAIINLDDPALISAINEGGIKVISRHPDPQTLIRVFGHYGPILHQRFESPGEILIINPDGMKVEIGSGLESTVSSTIAEVKAHGNVYALAIKEKGSISATKLNGVAPKPTTFDFPDMETTSVISDK